jgi:ATP-dependent NAD(P)H-hydrate dehydratase
MDSKLKTILNHLLPQFLPSQYKGNSGKVAVIGGSQEYTGAPYYAAYSALLSGSDLSFVICPPEALIPIKCYSPEIIVHPNTVPIQAWLNMAKTFVVGPGLGRSEHIEPMLINFMNQAQNTNVIMDADALWFLAKSE